MVLLNSPQFHHGHFNWEMKKASPGDNGAILSLSKTKGEWMPAIVPGTILNSLVFNEVYPDPYWDTNNKLSEKKIPDIAEVGRDFYTYWFRTEFDYPEINAGQKCWLQFDGINYIAHIWLNGKKLGRIKGMFVQPVFDVTDLIKKDGKNVLAVLVEPVEFPGSSEPRMKENVVVNENRNGGSGELGKNVTMLMSAGWDFTFPDGIRDRNTGIWREIKLFTTGGVTLQNPFIKSKLNAPEYDMAKLVASVEVSNHAKKPVLAEITGTLKETSGQFRKKIQLAAGESQTVTFLPEEFEALNIRSPRLWWPVNQGNANLYHAEFSVSTENNNSASDIEDVSFGIREITSDTNTPDGSRVFKVNGRRIFIHGSNWIPEAMLRTSAERTTAELLMTKQAGINMLRLWGGGISESDLFFELCDSLGIMVWHEFWMTGDTKAPVDHDLYLENVRSTIKRIRNHPSLAYYVSSNEQDDVLNIQPILQELDDTRGYQHQSECCGVHDGSPYKHENPMQYYDNTASDRGSRIDGFCPEYGATCLPPLECLKEMMPEEKIWPVDKNTWDYLDGGAFHYMTTKYQDAINEYGASANAAEFVMKGQMIGAMSYRSIWENWNYNKFEYGDRFASGVLFWYHNSPIRQVCGRMWDWSLEPTAALYFTQNALHSLHPQFDYLKNTVSVVNDFPKSFENYQLDYKVYNLNSTIVAKGNKQVDIPANGVKNDVLTIQFPEKTSEVHFIKLTIKNPDGQVVGDSFYWRSGNHYQGPWTVSGPNYAGFESLNQMPETSLKCKVFKKSDNRKYTISIENSTTKLAFFNRIKLTGKNGQLIRPVLYSDNYFSLEPGEKKEISAELLNKSAAPEKMILEGWNVEPMEIKIK